MVRFNVELLVFSEFKSENLIILIVISVEDASRE